MEKKLEDKFIDLINKMKNTSYYADDFEEFEDMYNDVLNHIKDLESKETNN